MSRFALGVVALLLAVQATAQGTVTGVKPIKTSEGLEVQILGKDLKQPRTFRVNQNKSLLIEFDANLEGKARSERVRQDWLKYYSYGWFKPRPPKVRVHLMMTDGNLKPHFVQNDKGWLVTLKPNAVAKKDFPNALPPLEPAKDVLAAASGEEQPKQAAPAPTPARPKPVMVSLDFVNTEVVQILKALAMQSKVNIVTAPDVAGKLTVSLDTVSVEQALDFVTAMAGVRYAKVGNTYVVATASKFTDTLNQIGGKVDDSSETRVVNIFSGEGRQIKAAVLKTIPPSTIDGRYDLVLPSDQVSVEQTTDLTSRKDGDKEVLAGGGATTVETRTSDDKSKRDDYVVVVGTPARLQEVETMIRGIDRQISQALGIKIPANQGVLQRMYEPHGVAAEDLLRTIKSDTNLNLGNVQLLATPKTSLSRQVIVISGRENDVDKVYAMLSSLDQSTDAGPTSYEVVSLKYVTPQNAMVDLMAAVPGLRANLMPPPVDPTRGVSYNAQALSGAGSGSNGAAGAGGGAGQGAAAGGNSQTTSVSAETNTFATPMKLMLNGTREQIARAQAHLALIDVAPKQVALELRVMELTREDALRIGLDWSLLTGGTLRSIRINQGTASAGSAGSIDGSLGFKGGGQLDITGALDQVANRGNLIARPNLLASDGRLTKLFVGDEVRYVEQIQATQNGTSVTIGQVNVGVSLQVMPRVGTDGNISLSLMPELSILRGFTPIPGGGQLPQTSVRRAESLVNLKSGETLAIGGLIQDQDRRNVSGIPILKDLPIVGQLFKRTDNSKVRTEVVFFLTVREVNEIDRQNAANPRTNEERDRN